MKQRITRLGSSLGKKYIMGLTGLVLFLFVIGHMLGNLQIFLGAEKINAYGALLKSMPKLIWVARLSLLACLVLHVWTAITLTFENRAARPHAYAVHDPLVASYASRTMIWSGLIVFAFIVYHLIHFTIAPGFTEHDAQGRHDIFKMVILGFSNPLASGAYVIAMATLCLHLSHGIRSMGQTLGLRTGGLRLWFDRAAILLSWIIFIANSSIPVAILLGYGKEVL